MGRARRFPRLPDEGSPTGSLRSRDGGRSRPACTPFAGLKSDSVPYGRIISWTGNSLMSGGPCGSTPAAAIPSAIRAEKASKSARDSQ